MLEMKIGITENSSAHPLQAVFYSAVSFTVGAALPLTIAWAVFGNQLIPAVAASSLVFLALLGGIAARAGGAKITVGAIRVTFWGALAIALTAGVGRFFGVSA